MKRLSKGGTLVFFRANSKHFSVPFLVLIDKYEWGDDPDAVLSRIRETFTGEQVAVRSSSYSEDGHSSSNAGKFHTVLNVDPSETKSLREAIEEVFSSMDSISTSHPGDHIIIQEMVTNAKVSGVVFTREPNTNAPYYVINYDDESGATDSVTSGRGESANRTMFVFRDATDRLKSPRFAALLRAVKEVEELLESSTLDLEFALSDKDEVQVLQARPISTLSLAEETSNDLLAQELRSIEESIGKEFSNPTGSGHRKAFSSMSDWNPAEIVGRKPKALAFSLYDKLVTSKSWAVGRSILGYQKPKSTNLLKSIGGQPFVDVCLSFESFLPQNISSDVAKKLFMEWLERLIENPNLHDKVEFDVAITCWSFDFDSKISRLATSLTKFEKIEIERRFKELTFSCIAEEGSKSINSLLTAANQFQNPSTNLSNLTIEELIDECSSRQAVAFSALARHAFIAKTLMDSLVARNIISNEELGHWNESIETVTSQFLVDANGISGSQTGLSDFLEKYGHLRPGTYDIESKRYDQMDWTSSHTVKLGGRKATGNSGNFSRTTMMRIDKALSEHSVDLKAYQLVRYCGRAISAREYSKFVFSKLISEILERIANTASDLGISRSEAAHISIDEWLEIFNRPLSIDERFNQLKREIQKSEERYCLTSSIRLPEVISDTAGLYVVPFQVSIPNYVTRERVEAEVVIISSYDDDIELGGKVVAVENADPGYDWIFTHEIEGLVTKYGGTNSHMAIRCSELGVPAVIGCGEQIFSSLVNSKRVSFDCSARTIVGGR